MGGLPGGRKRLGDPGGTTGARARRGRVERAHVPPVGLGSGGGGVVGSGDGGGVVVGGAGGGFGVVVVTDGFGAGGGAAEVLVSTGAAVVVEPPPVGAGRTGAAGVRLGVAFGAGRLLRDAGGGFRTAVAGLTVPAGLTVVVDFCSAGVAFAIAAAREPVATTVPAATPLVTSDNRRSARSRWSRWWAGGEAIGSLPDMRQESRSSPCPAASPRPLPGTAAPPPPHRSRRTAPPRPAGQADRRAAAVRGGCIKEM